MIWLGPYGEYSLVLELLILTLISVRQCQRRSRFAWRAACSLLAMCGFSVLIFKALPTAGYLGIYRPYWYIALLGAALCFCFELRFSQAAYLLAIAYALQYSMYTLWLLLCRFCVPDFVFAVEMPKADLFYLLAFFAAVAAAWYLSRQNKYLQQIKSFHAPVLTVFILVILAAVYLTGETIKTGTLDAIIMMRIACTIICVVSVAYASTVLVYQQVTLNHALYHHLLQRQKAEYEQRRASVEDINIKCHDLKYQIRAAFENNGQGNREALREIEDSIKNIQNAYRTGNDPLDIIISEKARLCSQKNISFTFLGDGSLISFMRDVDIYRLFSNAIDNAIEAVARVEDEKKIIGVTIQKDGPFLIVHVENYCSGALQMADELPQTSKQDKQNHGFGMRSMKSVAARYQGELSFHQDGDVFSLDILFPVKQEKKE